MSIQKQLRDSELYCYTTTCTLSVRVPGCQKLQITAYPVWHRMFYSRIRMATVGVKVLNATKTATSILNVEVYFCPHLDN